MAAIAACEPNAAVSRRLGRGLGTVRSRRKRFTPNAWRLAARGGPSGIFADRDGTVPW
jgi:hypothetical protein